MTGIVTAVSRNPTHSFSKTVEAQIVLLPGLGVDGDAHCGATARIRGRWGRGKTKPNLCQVHLLQEELFGELAKVGFNVVAGDIGENVTTRNLDLLSLPTGALLHIGATAVVEVTGLRTPCRQLDRFSPGLMTALRTRDGHGKVVLKAGIMSVVTVGGVIYGGDAIVVELPAAPHRALEPV